MSWWTPVHELCHHLWRAETVHVCPVNCYIHHEEYSHYNGFTRVFIRKVLHAQPYTIYGRYNVLFTMWVALYSFLPIWGTISSRGKSTMLVEEQKGKKIFGVLDFYCWRKVFSSFFLYFLNYLIISFLKDYKFLEIYFYFSFITVIGLLNR